MNRTTKACLTTLALCLSLVAAPAAMAADRAPGSPVRFLTGPSEGTPLDIVMKYLQEHREELGLTAQDLRDLVVQDNYVSSHSGTTHLVLRQHLAGVPVHQGFLQANVARDGSIINLRNLFVSDLAGAANALAPAIGAEDAIHSAARHLGLTVSEPLAMEEALGGSALEARYTGGGISREAIPVRLVYEPRTDGAARLAWNLEIQPLDSDHWWDMRVDAQTGEVLAKTDWVDHDTYRVFPFPFRHPQDPGAGHVLVVDPADLTASPFAWHDDNCTAGAEYNDTRGNNVWAQEDTDANNTGGFRPTANGPNLTFDYPWNPAQEPDEGTNQEAAIVNLFYWNNIIHDLLYQYGFDEPGGNFQQCHHTGMGGAPGDPVQADAQDGSGVNNANFATPPDGIDPRMQMFVWTNPFPNFLTVTSPGSIADDYIASGSAFGPAVSVAGISGNVVLANDGTGTPSDGCEPFTNGGAINGNIALVDRGNCNFTVKVKNAQLVGATATIVVNNQGDTPTTLGGTDPTVTIPSGMIGQSDGNVIKAELGGGVVATFRNQGGTAPPNRDSDMDAEVIIHEYVHGLSNRLTGGPGNSGCLSGQEQMGEGWSDWYALALTARAGDVGTTPRGMATYVAYQPTTGPGIRTLPYSTDMMVNNHTYASIAGLSVPHGVGSVWAAMLWDLHWDLVDEHGFDPDIFGGSGGNNLAIQLVTDGLKLQGCLPNFVIGRNAILLADQNLTGGANQCIIWRAFARRGVGEFANAGSTAVVGDETEDFTVPFECRNDLIFTDEFESGDTSEWGNILDASGDASVTAAAGLVGTVGLAITVNDDERVWVEDASGGADERYRGRFYFDPNSIAMDNGIRQRLFQLFANDPNRRLVTVVLRWQGGTFRVLTKVHLDDNSWLNTGFVDITDAPHWLEFDWVKSDGSDNGSLEMFIDGVSVGDVLTGLDNDASVADRARLGIVSAPKPNTLGTIYFDAFESHRFTPVGAAVP